jgi:hypothetical protein
MADLNKLKAQLEDFKVARYGTNHMLEHLEDQDSQQAQIYRGRIAELDENIQKHEKEINDIETLEQKREKKANWEAVADKIDAAILDNNIGYIIPEDKFIYCRDHGLGQPNPQFKMFNSQRISRMISKLSGVDVGKKDTQEMIDYFEKQGRTYLDTTASFNKNKWNEGEIYNKMTVIRSKWLQPDYDYIDHYDRSLDVLIYCICGGKQENIEHLEKWIGFKYLYPERNANTPNLDLGGMPGGNGKSIMRELLKTIFTPTCVISAHKEELEKFNSGWELAVIICYDEPEENDLAPSRLKQVTGSEDMRIEKKGIDATMADRNYNFIFTSNNENGVVKLSGGGAGGEDRRYSVINTNLVLLDEAMTSSTTKEEAYTWVNNLAQTTVKSAKDAAGFLARIIKQYDIENMTSLPALHGADYTSRFEDQKDALTELFDSIKPLFLASGIMPLSVLVDLVEAKIQSKISEKTINTKWTSYLKRNKINVEEERKVRYQVLWKGDEIKSAQGKVFNMNNTTDRSIEISVFSNSRPALIGGTAINTSMFHRDSLLI